MKWQGYLLAGVIVLVGAIVMIDLVLIFLYGLANLMGACGG